MSTPYPIVSIITATLNRACILENAIHSVAQQTYPHIEYLIIDGGSEDHTIEIIHRNQKHISRWISQEDKGIYDAFNKGVEIATGDIIYFLNSDDTLYDADVIADVAKKFQDDLHLEIVYGNVLVTDHKQYYGVTGKPLMKQDLQRGQFCNHQGFFVRKHLFAQLGLFDLQFHLASDYEFMLKCFLHVAPTASFYLHRVICSFHIGGVSSNPQHEAMICHERQLILQKCFGNEIDSHLLLKKFYSSWLQQVLATQQGICHPLKLQGINSVVILGTLSAGQCLYFDAKNAGIKVVAFLDNNTNLQDKYLFDVPVLSSQSLIEWETEIDAILISVESSQDIQIKEQFYHLTSGKIPIFLWKELIDIEVTTKPHKELCTY